MSGKLVVPTEIFSRVSGYFRPVEQWNRGKREEFRLRKYLKLNKTITFIEKKEDISKNYLMG